MQIEITIGLCWQILFRRILSFFLQKSGIPLIFSIAAIDNNNHQDCESFGHKSARIFPGDISAENQGRHQERNNRAGRIAVDSSACRNPMSCLAFTFSRFCDIVLPCRKFPHHNFRIFRRRYGKIIQKPDENFHGETLPIRTPLW